eukprot:CAMPEP_0114500056 /NCGR_PEP_ID=MMETSP0109-20121206/7753_1 /TAXON_ID=29199 /ORGANISM="Chlorarachnion reptans, Strain CCCM449" /LENGTH=664 /DNA_ID=CAMNT_0001677677 /DNA_START=353 /DNA_END=2347 /DNA_ORIENTATION=-
MNHLASTRDRQQILKSLASQRSLTPQPTGFSGRGYKYGGPPRFGRAPNGTNGMHPMPFEIINCRFRSSGCYVRLPRNRMELHLRNNAANHSLLLLGRIDEQEREKRKLSARMMALEKSVFAITEFLGNLDHDAGVPSADLKENKNGVKTKVTLKDIIRNLHTELARAKMTPDIKPTECAFQGPRVSLAALSGQAVKSEVMLPNSGVSSAPATPVTKGINSLMPPSQLPKPISLLQTPLAKSESEDKGMPRARVQSASSDSDDVQVEIQIHNPAVNAGALGAPMKASFNWENGDERENEMRENGDNDGEADERRTMNVDVSDENRIVSNVDNEGENNRDDGDDEGVEHSEEDEDNEKNPEDQEYAGADDEDGNDEQINATPEEQDSTAETLVQMSELCAKIKPNMSLTPTSVHSSKSSLENDHVALRDRTRNAKRPRRAISYDSGDTQDTSNSAPGSFEKVASSMDIKGSSTRSSTPRPIRFRRSQNGAAILGFSPKANTKQSGRKGKLGIDQASLRAQTQQAAKRVQQLMDEDGKLMNKKRKTRHRTLKQKFGLNAFEAPKKPKTAYNYYQIGVRESILKELLRESNGHLGSKEVQSQKIARVIGERWKAMPDHERQIFNNLAAKDKERYKRDLDDYVKLSKQLEQSRKLSVSATSKTRNLPAA